MILNKTQEEENGLQKIPIVREGYPFVLTFLALTLLVGILFHPYWMLIPGFLTAFMAFFFRNPERKITNDEKILVSPADGKVMAVTELTEDQFLNQKAKKVTIFLSVLDVHVNRSPINGEIKFQEYFVGRFKAAYKTVATFENERHAIGIENKHLKVVVIQIAGLLARRIVSWVTLGSNLERGERYGLIKFGSCTELIVPEHVQILVKPGDRVKGGTTIIGRIDE